MMKTACLLSCLLASASAFAPATQSRSSSAMNAMTFEDQPGVLAPTGYWDPLGLATSEKLFDFYRSVEIKHGRVAMLAVLGYVVPEFYRFGYDISFTMNTNDVTNGIGAFKDVPPLGWVQMIFFVGLVEQTGFLGDFEVGKPDLDPEVFAKRQTQELQHGRLAMLATMELLRHDWQNTVVPGFDGYDNLITGLPFLYN